MKEKEKFWMIVTVNGQAAIDEDDCGRPRIYSEKEAQRRAKDLALSLGEGHFVCVMEYVYGEQGKMITERIDPMRTPEYKECKAEAQS